MISLHSLAARVSDLLSLVKSTEAHHRRRSKDKILRLHLLSIGDLFIGGQGCWKGGKEEFLALSDRLVRSCRRLPHLKPTISRSISKEISYLTSRLHLCEDEIHKVKWTNQYRNKANSHVVSRIRKVKFHFHPVACKLVLNMRNYFFHMPLSATIIRAE